MIAAFGACRNLELLRVRHWGPSIAAAIDPSAHNAALLPTESVDNNATALGGASRLGGPSEESDEALARLRHDEPVRLKHVALQEMPSEDKAGGDVAFGDRRGVIDQEGRQLEQLVAIRLGGIARHGAARARRHIDEVCVDASRGAFGQVEPEAELAQELKLPLDEKGGPRRGIVERAQHVQRRAI